MHTLRTAHLTIAVSVMNGIHDRIARTRRRGEAGYTTEAVIAMVALAALALTVMATLGPKIIAKVQSINLGG